MLEKLPLLHEGRIRDHFQWEKQCECLTLYLLHYLNGKNSLQSFYYIYVLSSNQRLKFMQRRVRCIYFDGI
jgi:hypothetical protein